MEPNLLNGDWWLVLQGARVRAGDIVLFTHPQRESLQVVKRARRRVAEGWWVEGDNSESSDDSRYFGPLPDGLIHGRLLFRYRPLLRG